MYMYIYIYIYINLGSLDRYVEGSKLPHQVDYEVMKVENAELRKRCLARVKPKEKKGSGQLIDHMFNPDKMIYYIFSIYIFIYMVWSTSSSIFYWSIDLVY